METVGEPVVVADHGSSLTWDGRYLPGPWLTRRAIAVARIRLVEYPAVTVSIRRSHHIACLQVYLRPVTEAGLVILLCCSDPASRTVTPHGGVAPRFSPNPLAAGIPTNGDPILIDISTSSTSNGLCNRLAAAGERLPGPWLVTTMEMRPTTRVFWMANQEEQSCPWAAWTSVTKASPWRFLSRRSRTHSAGMDAPTMNRVGGLRCSCRFWIPSVLVGEHLFCAR